MDTAAGIRREVEALRCNAEELKRENAMLDVQLKKHRAAAAKDLERAVPLVAPGCWGRAVDGPAMKAIALLMRSTCLRRTLALHLLATYAWLFFLLFWLEK